VAKEMEGQRMENMVSQYTFDCSRDLMRECPHAIKAILINGSEVEVGFVCHSPFSNKFYLRGGEDSMFDGEIIAPMPMIIDTRAHSFYPYEPRRYRMALFEALHSFTEIFAEYLFGQNP
jgi:hypothetical protein